MKCGGMCFWPYLGTERSDPSSYRGISLLPVLGKVLQRIMVFRLEDKINNTLCRWQFGFKEGRSVEHAWMHVKKRVADSIILNG